MKGSAFSCHPHGASNWPPHGKTLQPAQGRVEANNAILLPERHLLRHEDHWRIQGGGQGAMAPPKRDMGGAKVSFGPPQKADVIHIFFMRSKLLYDFEIYK